MSRSKEYQKLLNDRKWKELRAIKLRNNPLCELCEKEGRVSAAVDVHHIKPVEGVKRMGWMRHRCYNYDNLMSLCIPCHVKVHKEQRSHSKESHQQTEANRLSRWIERHS